MVLKSWAGAPCARRLSLIVIVGLLSAVALAIGGVVKLLFTIAEYISGGIAAAVLADFGNFAVADFKDEMVGVVVDAAIVQFGPGLRFGAHAVFFCCHAQQ